MNDTYSNDLDNRYNEDLRIAEREYQHEISHINRENSDENDKINDTYHDNLVNFNNYRTSERERKFFILQLDKRKKFSFDQQARKHKFDLKEAKDRYDFRVKHINREYKGKGKAESGVSHERVTVSKDNKRYAASKKKRSIWNFFGILIILIVGTFLIVISDYRVKEAEFEGKIKDIQGKIRVTYRQENFQVNKIPATEFVESHVGDYYKVDLNLSSYQERVLFPEGEYSIPRDDSRLISSIAEFKSKIYESLDRGREVRLFVKGTADSLGNKSFIDTLRSPYDKNSGFSKIRYLVKDPKVDKYLFKVFEKEIGPVIDNKDLPNLRARFLQEILSNENDDIAPSLLLNGTVTNRIDEKERNAYLILFIDWNSKKNENLYFLNKLFYLGIVLLTISIFCMVYFKYYRK